MSLYKIHQQLKDAEKLCHENIVACVREHPDHDEICTAQEFIKLLDEITNALNFIDNSGWWNRN